MLRLLGNNELVEGVVVWKGGWSPFLGAPRRLMAVPLAKTPLGSVTKSL